MKDFAKIFNTSDYGQVLITNDSRDDKPSINAFFTINDNFGVCELSCKFEDSDKGRARCDAFFDDVTEQKAIKMVEPSIIAMLE